MTWGKSGRYRLYRDEFLQGASCGHYERRWSAPVDHVLDIRGAGGVGSGFMRMNTRSSIAT